MRGALKARVIVNDLLITLHVHYSHDARTTMCAFFAKMCDQIHVSNQGQYTREAETNLLPLRSGPVGRPGLCALDLD